MDTITHIETETGPDGTHWTYCTYEIGRQCFVARLPWTEALLDFHQNVAISSRLRAGVWPESTFTPNRPGDEYDDAENGACVGELTIREPQVAPSVARRAMEYALLRAVALNLNPGCREAVDWVQERDQMAEAGLARSEVMRKLTQRVRRFMRQSGREFDEPTLAAFGAYRYLHSLHSSRA